MRSRSSGRARARAQQTAAVAGMAAVAILIGACGSARTSDSAASADSGAAASTTADGGSSTARTVGSGVTVTAPTQCGDNVVYRQSDPDSVLATLPDETRANYTIYPYDVRASPWTRFAGRRGPWKIGYINFPVNNPWQVNLSSGLKDQFAQAKAKGLVTGDLDTYIQPSTATATPEQQSAAIEQMVKAGVDGILLHPLNAIAETKAIDDAGKAGVPIVLTGDAAPNSTYALNMFVMNQSPSYADTLRLLKDQGKVDNGRTINVLDVRGIPGNTAEQTYHNEGQATMRACRGMKEIGTVWGQWNPASTKTEVLKFIASHPGNIDFVMQQGSMSAGVIQAFEQAGKPVPPMPMGGTSGGDLAWWAANKDRFSAAGAQYGGKQVAYTAMRILLRTLAGNGPKLRDLAFPAPMVTNDNIDEFATPGKDVTWIGDPRGPLDALADTSRLDGYFSKPGNPGGM
ncbi:MAG TPA: substrate-binding domain-containing protein [Conexibacter sp.]|jgi:ribose transport system substrate-binding protein